jgi:hypothetical protein
MEDTILQNIDTIKKIVKSKFKEKMWCDKELEEKRKIRYYKDVINPNLEDQNYLSIFPSVVILGIGQFLKHHGMKEFVTFVTLIRLNMKSIFS